MPSLLPPNHKRLVAILGLAVTAALALSPQAEARGGSHHTSDFCTSCARDSHGRIARSPEAREQFMRETGYPHGRPGYVIDHVIR